jgi:hypothetical protein
MKKNTMSLPTASKKITPAGWTIGLTSVSLWPLLKFSIEPVFGIIL